MKNLIGHKVLITSTSWFFAPDGRQYRAVFGVLVAIHTSQDTLGFTPSRTHTNWYVQVGNVTIAGCQVLQCVKTDECDTGAVEDYSCDRTVDRQHTPGEDPRLKNSEMYVRPSMIYRAK